MPLNFILNKAAGVFRDTPYNLETCSAAASSRRVAIGHIQNTLGDFNIV